MSETYDPADVYVPHKWAQDTHHVWVTLCVPCKNVRVSKHGVKFHSPDGQKANWRWYSSIDSAKSSAKRIGNTTVMTLVKLYDSWWSRPTQLILRSDVDWNRYVDKDDAVRETKIGSCKCTHCWEKPSYDFVVDVLVVVDVLAGETEKEQEKGESKGLKLKWEEVVRKLKPEVSKRLRVCYMHVLPDMSVSSVSGNEVCIGSADARMPYTAATRLLDETCSYKYVYRTRVSTFLLFERLLLMIDQGMIPSRKVYGGYCGTHGPSVVAPDSDGTLMSCDVSDMCDVAHTAVNASVAVAAAAAADTTTNEDIVIATFLRNKGIDATPNGRLQCCGAVDELGVDAEMAVVTHALPQIGGAYSVKICHAKSPLDALCWDKLATFVQKAEMSTPVAGGYCSKFEEWISQP